MTYDVKVIQVHCHATLDFGLTNLFFDRSQIGSVQVHSPVGPVRLYLKIVGPTLGPDRDRDRTEVVHPWLWGKAGFCTH